MTFSGNSTRKRFGQHWLRDESVLERILVAADIHDEDHILEVGPGTGNLTKEILSKVPKKVFTVEIVKVEKLFPNLIIFSIIDGGTVMI